MAYGSSQARGWIGAAAAGLHHSHSKTDPSHPVTCTAACGDAESLTYWTRPGIESPSSQRQSWVLNLLSHNNRNSYFDFLWYLHQFVARFKSKLLGFLKKLVVMEFPLWCSGYWIRLGIMRLWVWSLASLNGLRIRHCHELWCRSQTQLGSQVAVAVVQAGGYSSN